MDRIKVSELHQRFKDQGVSTREHIAFVCPICGTAQSMASLIAAGVNPEKVESYIGFSCEGRWTDAGPWVGEKDKSAKAKKRRGVRGCDWTLGGLFTLHTLEVETDDGKFHPRFQPATPEQARALEGAPAKSEAA